MKIRMWKIFLMFLLTLSIVTLTTLIGSVSASPENWVEVIRFTGSGTEQYTSEYFTCDHVEWRIRWEYVPDPEYPEFALFNVYTYPQGEDTLFIDSIIKSGADDTSGVSYIHNNAGTFYMKINVANTQSYTIIVEQDLDSIPEFPSFLILPLLFILSTLLFVGYKGKLGNHRF
ncbi:hypothetical protein J7K27_00770 [Candidatus Bathyarchaeota archaeon]|nr:hypothetical protein [Candidatus Bathyarchaeota archaeon]